MHKLAIIATERSWGSYSEVMLKVGLTGGMGSGKSTVARRLRELGATVIDADAIAREIVEPGQPALRELATAFGTDILLADGSLNRAELARRAFADDASRETLNSITHPRIAERTAERYREAAETGAEIVVYDMPLLIENGLDKDQDVVVVVHADVATRLDRLVAHRGVDRDDAARRIAAQIDDETRKVAADIVLDNSGTEAQLVAQVDRVWNEELTCRGRRTKGGVEE